MLSFLACFTVVVSPPTWQNLMEMSDMFCFHSAFVMLKYNSLAICAWKGLKNKCTTNLKQAFLESIAFIFYFLHTFHQCDCLVR